MTSSRLLLLVLVLGLLSVAYGQLTHSTPRASATFQDIGQVPAPQPGQQKVLLEHLGMV
jgi:hypothetical protein